MAYRDDLEAAQHRITLLEQELKAARQAGEDRERALQAEIDRLLAELGRARPTRARDLWLICWLPATVVAALYLLSIILVMRDADAAGWGLSQAAIVAGILSTIWSWGRRGSGLRMGFFVALKAVIVAGWGWGWWHPLYSGLTYPGQGTPLYFFWCAPGVVLAIVLLEGILIRVGLRPVGD